MAKLQTNQQASRFPLRVSLNKKQHSQTHTTTIFYSQCSKVTSFFCIVLTVNQANSQPGFCRRTSSKSFYLDQYNPKVHLRRSPKSSAQDIIKLPSMARLLDSLLELHEAGVERVGRLVSTAKRSHGWVCLNIGGVSMTELRAAYPQRGPTRPRVRKY